MNGATNQIEEIRVKLGLSRPQMLKLLEAKPTAFRYFYLPDEQIDPLILIRAKTLEKEFDRWQRYLLRWVEAEGPVTLPRLSQMLRLAPLTIWSFVRKGYLPTIAANTDDHRLRYLVGVPQLEKFFENAQAMLRLPRASTSKLRGPMSEAFTRHLASNVKIH